MKQKLRGSQNTLLIRRGWLIDLVEFMKINGGVLSTTRNLSENNYQIRQKQTIVHTTGRTPHYVIAQKGKKRNDKSPFRIEMFITTHLKDGKPINAAAGEIMAKLSDLRASHEGSPSKAIDNEIFAQVVGPERPGRIRGYGMGPTPSQLVRGKQIASENYEEEIKSLKQIATVQNDRIKILEQALSAMGVTLPMPHSHHTDVGSEVPIHNHHDSHSEQEIGPSLQPQAQPGPDCELDEITRSRSHHSTHEFTSLPSSPQYVSDQPIPSLPSSAQDHRDLQICRKPS